MNKKLWNERIRKSYHTIRIYYIPHKWNRESQVVDTQGLRIAFQYEAAPSRKKNL